MTATAREIADVIARANSGAPDADPGEFDRLLADDVTWQVVGRDLAWARTYHGKAEVYGEYMGPLQQRLDPAATTITNVDTFVDDVAGAIVFHNHDVLAFLSGESVEVDVILVMRVTDGLITHIREVMDLRQVAEVIGPALG
jgi:ketosteroid isomerase-like protein